MSFSSQSMQIEQILDERFASPGFFLEIGAWDGELISQTAWLEKEREWQGVCVDPFPRNFGRRSCRLVRAAISRDGKPREFFRVTTDKRYDGDVSYFSGFLDSVEINLPLIREHCNYTVVDVDTMTFQQLREVCDLPAYIEFLSIDTEGSEVEILESIDFASCSFGVIMVEHNRSEDIKAAIASLLLPHGYHLLKSMEIDDVYVRL